MDMLSADDAQNITFEQMSAFGILWAINRYLFHPMGYALGLDPKSGAFTMYGDGTEPISFSAEVDADKFEAFRRFQVAQREFLAARRANAGPKRAAILEDTAGAERIKAIDDEGTIHIPYEFDELDVATAIGEAFFGNDRDTVLVKLGSSLTKWVSREQTVDEVIEDLQRAKTEQPDEAGQVELPDEGERLDFVDLADEEI
jgi:hypothetical protein